MSANSHVTNTQIAKVYGATDLGGGSYHLNGWTIWKCKGGWGLAQTKNGQYVHNKRRKFLRWAFDACK